MNNDMSNPQTTKEKYAQFKLSKDTKEVDKFPPLDEKLSKQMQEDFIKGK